VGVRGSYLRIHLRDSRKRNRDRYNEKGSRRHVMNFFVAIRTFLFVPSGLFLISLVLKGLEGESGNPESAIWDGFPSPEPDRQRFTHE
jgi:hypothetical protein